ncbi:cryptochrome [Violaceomyces palustris]|uniref:Cryptochrome n=1 Tax=Violaceomyces palustris TaxID=1673888 RepID=A0ACD0NSZ7_9BASI|nr:cryptochrome [Violaceomyces palustris]
MADDSSGASPSVGTRQQRSGIESQPETRRSDSPGSEHGRSILICLLRLDLRLHDNALFYYAHQTPKPIVHPLDGKVDLSNVTKEALLGSSSDYLLPVFVFDEREMELSGLPNYERKGPEARTREFGFWKTGSFRTRFISESVYDLRSRLRESGSDLLIRFGFPEEVIYNLVEAIQSAGDTVEGVWMQKEMTYPETEVESQIQARLQGKGVPIHFVHGKTLIHPNDLPFAPNETPDVFTPFRKRVEALGPKMVRPPLTCPDKFKPFPSNLPKIPDYALDVTYEVDVDGFAPRAPETKDQQQGQLSFHDILRYLLTPLNGSQLPRTLESNALLQQRHPASAFPLRGGETSALDRLDWYFVRGKSADSSRWGKADPPPVARYKQTRNNLLGHAYSTKMSPFLAYGSISPRQIWEALDAHEEKFGEDQNTYWVRFELLWRDYFFFVAEKFGNLLYELGGFELVTDPRQAAKKVEDGWWKKWDPLRDGPENEMTRLLEGRTGIPFIDANILELRESGFMSNRGRQNIASFLSKDLGYDWRIGAEFFQSHLIDYDPTSNYGNWQYVAGVGNDPRASRQFNTIKQAKDYDSHGEYVKMWIPALRNLHPDYVHTPWLLDEEERRRYGLKTTRMEVTMDGYPSRPLIEHEGWHKHYERRQGVGSKMHGNPQEKVKDVKVPRRHKPNNRFRPSASVGVSGGLSAVDRSNDLMAASAGTQLGHSGPPRNVIPPLRLASGSIGPGYVQRQSQGLPLVATSNSFAATGKPVVKQGVAGASIGPPANRPRAFDFGSRPISMNGHDGAKARRDDQAAQVVGFGTSPLATVPFNTGATNASSKADSEASWRRGPTA